MRAALVALVLLCAFIVPAHGWNPTCQTSVGVYSDGAYLRESRASAVGWTYTAVPLVTMIRATFYTVPFSYTEVFTRIVTIPPPPHTETFTYTVLTHTTVYTDVLAPLGFVPYAVTDRDLGLRFTAPHPFTLYHCAPGTTAHTFLPLVNSSHINRIAARRPIN